MMDGRHIGISLPIAILTYSYWYVILHPPAKFRSNRTSIPDFCRHIDFLR